MAWVSVALVLGLFGGNHEDLTMSARIESVSKTSRCPRTYTSNGPRQPQPLHGLKLVIKEEVLPMKD